jgi:purine-cytosine permease-like protein
MMAVPLIGIISSYALYSTFKNNLSKFIVLIGAIIIPMLIIYNDGLFKMSNTKQLIQLDRVNYVLSMTKQGDKVYDGDIRFNIFRDDIDYFWYCVGDNECLDSYRKITNYNYDIYELISAQKPKVISTFGIDNLDDPRIKNHYKTSEKYKDLLIRID